mgnify:CR=1 FL=1
MATEKKDRPWDGRSRPSDDKYRKNFNRIFGVKSKDSENDDTLKTLLTKKEKNIWQHMQPKR